MDFGFDAEVAAVADLAQKIFTEQAPVSRLQAVERAGGFDAELWHTLAEAGLLGIAVPEDLGGAGLGVLALAALLEQQGRRVAPVPLWPAAVAAMPIARFGSPAQRERWLAGLVDGTHVLTGSFDNGAGQAAPVTARADGVGWRLTGRLVGVPAAGQAAGYVLPVRLPDGSVRTAVLPGDRDAVALVEERATDQLAAATVTLDGVAAEPGDLLDGGEVDVAAWTLRRARTALAALSAGVCAEALAMTATYTSHRMQFGRPLSTNQGVAIRAADAYLDTQNVRLTAYRAATLLDEGREQEADAAALVANWWASTGGLRVVHATQHLHGGMGADVDYPIHRYFLWGRQIAFTLGGAAATLAELGDALESIATIG